MRREDEPDEVCMLAYRDGDADAFETLYRRHRDPLYRYLRRHCGDGAAAEEMFQDVWLRVVRGRERYRVEARFATFLYRIAHNRLIDHYRATGRERRAIVQPGADPPPEPAADPRHEPERAAHAERQAQRLLALIDTLPAEQREAFLLREEAGLGVEEIADITGVAREAAKSRLRYAVAKLRRALGDAT